MNLSKQPSSTAVPFDAAVVICVRSRIASHAAEATARLAPRAMTVLMLSDAAAYKAKWRSRTVDEFYDAAVAGADPSIPVAGARDSLFHR